MYEMAVDKKHGDMRRWTVEQYSDYLNRKYCWYPTERPFDTWAKDVVDECNPRTQGLKSPQRNVMRVAYTVSKIGLNIEFKLHVRLQLTSWNKNHHNLTTTLCLKGSWIYSSSAKDSFSVCEDWSVVTRGRCVKCGKITTLCPVQTRDKGGKHTM